MPTLQGDQRDRRFGRAVSWRGPGLRGRALGIDALGGVRQRFRYQLPAIVHAIERDEAAHARSLRGAEQGFVERLEPVTQAFELVALADLEHDVLDRLAIRIRR